MTFNAIFDESGTHDASGLMVFAGLVVDVKKCDELSRQWNKRLRRKPTMGLGFLHMSELNLRHKKSSDHERTALEALVADLARIICEYATEGCVNSITVGKFKALSPALRKRYRDPFYYAFEAGVKAMASSASLEPKDLVSLICDDSDKYALQCLESFKRLKRLEPAIAAKIPFIGFGEDKMYPPLQAADMFAYCYRAKLNASPKGLWAEPLSILEATFSDVVSVDSVEAN